MVHDIQQDVGNYAVDAFFMNIFNYL